MVIHYFCRLYSIISYYKIMASISCAVNNRGWDGWMASPAKRTRVWANSWRQWRTEKPALLKSMEWQSQHHLAAEQQQNSGYNSLCCEKTSLLLIYFTHVYVCQSLRHVQLFVTPCAEACQAPLSMGFSRQEYWSGSPFPSPGDLPYPGIEPRSPALQADSSLSEPPGK